MSITNLPSGEFASSLAAMTDDEVFETMRSLEELSMERSISGKDLDPEISHKLAVTEDEIARRYPGQLLQPFLDWKRRRGLMQ
jgi:hypothetical protein